MGCSGSKASGGGSAPEVVGFEPTEAQAAGQIVAANAIAALVAEAEAEVTAEAKSNVPDSWRNDTVRGPELEQMMVSSTLLDAQYLLALHDHGGVLPRWQDIPAAARIDQSNVWRIRHAWDDARICYKTPTLVWTYCWYNKYHPDPIGEQLCRVAPVLRVMLEHVKEMGPHMTIGVLQDYGSYPQYPRTPGEQERFNAGLKAELNRWYAHPFTPVLMVTTPASEHPLHTNRRAYDARGWTYVEKRLSSVVKDYGCLWDLSKFSGSEREWRDLADSMRAGRPPMMSPERVERELREGVASGALAFTSSADLELVIGIYRRGFLEALEANRGVGPSRRILFLDCGWGDAEAPVLAEALRYAAVHLGKDGAPIEFHFRDNAFTENGQAQLRTAVEGSSILALEV